MATTIMITTTATIAIALEMALIFLLKCELDIKNKVLLWRCLERIYAICQIEEFRSW